MPAIDPFHVAKAGTDALDTEALRGIVAAGLTVEDVPLPLERFYSRLPRPTPTVRA